MSDSILVTESVFTGGCTVLYCNQVTVVTFFAKNSSSVLLSWSCSLPFPSLPFTSPPSPHITRSGARASGPLEVLPLLGSNSNSSHYFPTTTLYCKATQETSTSLEWCRRRHFSLRLATQRSGQHTSGRVTAVLLRAPSSILLTLTLNWNAPCGTSRDCLVGGERSAWSYTRWRCCCRTSTLGQAPST